MELPRDYPSFAKAAGRLMKPVAAELGFARITDTRYARDLGAMAHVIDLQVTRFGGENFYVSFGVALPTLGAPWLPERILKDEGLALYERLHNADHGQGYDCTSKAALATSIAQVATDLKAVALPWLAALEQLGQVASMYHERWDLQAIGHNVERQCFGVMHYGFLLAQLGDVQGALAWLREAKRLMVAKIDQEDLDLIGRALHDLEGGSVR